MSKRPKSRETSETRDLVGRFAVLAGLLVVTVLAWLAGLPPMIIVGLALIQGGVTLVVLLGLGREAPLVLGVMWLTGFFLIGLLALIVGAERTSLTSAIDGHERNEQGTTEDAE